MTQYAQFAAQLLRYSIQLFFNVVPNQNERYLKALEALHNQQPFTSKHLVTVGRKKALVTGRSQGANKEKLIKEKCGSFWFLSVFLLHHCLIIMNYSSSP